MFDAGNHIRIPDPTGVLQIGRRPLRGVVGVRMVDTYDFQSACAGILLDADQLNRIDAVAVVGRIGAGVAASHYLAHFAGIVSSGAQQHAATFEWVSSLGLAAQRIEIVLVQLQHCERFIA